jgi:hypothetical protein
VAAATDVDVVVVEGTTTAGVSPFDEQLAKTTTATKPTNHFTA